ncbi:MAG TPA: chemotaxis protein CheW [Candidatus Limnocylindrales bacterium]|nr:chemotaxis protein CheW [Candidatus Limnocylindrales bacterium]
MNATVQILVFRAAGRTFGIPLSQAERVIPCVSCTPLPNAPEIVLGVIDLHGLIVPVFDVGTRCGLPSRDLRLEDQFVIAHDGHRTVALLVDCAVGVVDRAIMPAHLILPYLDGVAGVTRFEDGLILIHDLERFLSAEEDAALTDALAHEQARDS